MSHEWGGRPASRLAFDAFLKHWDRETFPTEEVIESWTHVDGAGTKLSKDDQQLRLSAIHALTELLFTRAQARGRGDPLVSYDDLTQANKAHLEVVAALHERLFDQCFGELSGAGVEELGKYFVEFATCRLRRAAPAADATYQNGRPNGAIIVALPELSSLLAQRDRAQGIWHELHPWMVACIAAYGKSHYAAEHAKIGQYGLSSFRTSLELNSHQLGALHTQIKRLKDQPAFDWHWQNLLHLLAPATFDRLAPQGDDAFNSLDDYLASPPRAWNRTAFDAATPKWGTYIAIQPSCSNAPYTLAYLLASGLPSRLS